MYSSDIRNVSSIELKKVVSVWTHQHVSHTPCLAGPHNIYTAHDLCRIPPWYALDCTHLDLRLRLERKNRAVRRRRPHPPPHGLLLHHFYCPSTETLAPPPSGESAGKSDKKGKRFDKRSPPLTLFLLLPTPKISPLLQLPLQKVFRGLITYFLSADVEWKNCCGMGKAEDTVNHSGARPVTCFTDHSYINRSFRIPSPNDARYCTTPPTTEHNRCIFPLKVNYIIFPIAGFTTWTVAKY